MTDVKRLLDEATPLPWGIEFRTIVGSDESWIADINGSLSNPAVAADANLLLHAVNHLPDYEAAVDALAELIDAAYEALDLTSDTGSHMDDLDVAQQAARAALRRLRGES